jgi:hypothetical protein
MQVSCLNQLVDNDDALEYHNGEPKSQVNQPIGDHLLDIESKLEVCILK